MINGIIIGVLAVLHRFRSNCLVDQVRFFFVEYLEDIKRRIKNYRENSERGKGKEKYGGRRLVNVHKGRKRKISPAIFVAIQPVVS